MATKPRKTGRSHASWAEIIRTVQTPLGFFALVVLVVEVIFGTIATLSADTDRSRLLLGMFAIMFALIIIVAVLAAFRPESLHGLRPAGQGAAPPGVNSATVVQNSAAAEWYCEWRLGKKLKVYTEFLTLRTSADGVVTGNRRVESDTAINYSVVGFARGAFMWLEYHDPAKSGGGTLLLKEFTSGRLRGFVTSVNCDNGDLRCHLNQWLPVSERQSFDRTWQVLIGEVAEQPGR